MELADPQQARRNSASKVKRCLKKAFSLNLEGEDGDEVEDPESPVGAAVTPGGRKVKLKLRSSPVEQVMEMTQLEEEESAVAAARRTRKWSYQGTGSPASPVEAPKRHSFSTVSDRAGIVVSNNDLVSLLKPTHRLTPPGLPVPEDAPPVPPVAPNPRARGRSQSIAACWDNQQNATNGNKPEGDGPQVPITIRRTDCDYVSAPLLAQTSSGLEAPEEEDEGDENEKDGDDQESKLLWDSSGSTIDAGLLGSVIEQFLKTTKEEDDVGDVTSSMTGLQVK